jgi:hypothetical protein
MGRDADLEVLSGTGTMFRAQVLQDIARARGRARASAGATSSG